MDYVTPVKTVSPKKGVVLKPACPNVIDPDFVIENCNDGFCDRDMTLTFGNNKLYNSTLLPDDTTKESATTQAMLTTSLSFTEHKEVVYCISKSNINKLYHVVDNPEVMFDNKTKQYIATRHHYIDRASMTGIVIDGELENDNYNVVGIFSPRGYGKINAYNSFAKEYLTLMK